MTLVEEGNIGMPTVIAIDHQYTMGDNIRKNAEILNQVVEEALSKGNEVLMRSHNDKIFVYELEYKE